jgi:hypothetical protein
MATMTLWYPPENQPALLEWWRPLLLFLRELRYEDDRWEVELDDFELRGRIERRSGPTVYVYRHTNSGGEVYVDVIGTAQRFTPTPDGPALGRFRRWDTAGAAALHASLAMANRAPSRSPYSYEPYAPPYEPERYLAPPSGRRYGHLTLVKG